MYESPFNIIFEKINESLKETDKKLGELMVVQSLRVGVDVNKEELIKALEYDRGQYEKGYDEGYADGEAEAEEKYKWDSVEEFLPLPHEKVLLAVFGSDLIVQKEGETLEDALKRVRREVRYVTIGSRDEDDCWYGADGYPMMVQPSYWMRIPELPEEE